MIAVLRFLAVSLVSAFLILFSACVGATRMVTRERGSSGQQIDAKTFDASQVQPGSTTREKVLAQFSMINTGYNDPHLFWLGQVEVGLLVGCHRAEHERGWRRRSRRRQPHLARSQHADHIRRQRGCER